MIHAELGENPIAQGLVRTGEEGRRHEPIVLRGAMDAGFAIWPGGNSGTGDDDTPGGYGPICRNPGIRVTYYLFAPQGSGEAESFTPLKRRTTSRSSHL
ncbi:hypothetical protein GCM10009651_12520 [Microbacterium natoriense]